MRSIITIAAALLALAPWTVGAQAPPPMQAEVQREAMRRLAYMVGEWEGEGWMQSPQGRHAFRGGERVQAKLDGLALLVEGDFTAPGPDGTPMPVHRTLGVISFDPRAGAYRFRTWLATGSSGEHTLELTADGWRWHIDTPEGRIRYATRFSDDGGWHEVGEMERAGAWRQFFEMRLQRRSASAAGG